MLSKYNVTWTQFVSHKNKSFRCMPIQPQIMTVLHIIIIIKERLLCIEGVKTIAKNIQKGNKNMGSRWRQNRIKNMILIKCELVEIDQSITYSV